MVSYTGELHMELLELERKAVVDAVEDTDRLIGLLKDRGYGDRDRLLRKLLEEIGEYCEAIEFANGATRKIRKFQGIDPEEKLTEEIADVTMAALALARVEDMRIQSVLEIIRQKLSLREAEHERSLKERENGSE